MRKNSARAVYFKAPGEVELREERIRQQEGTVLVESRLMGISGGTEMLLFRGEMPSELESDLTITSLSGNLAYPVKYGYINTGSTPAAHLQVQESFHSFPTRIASMQRKKI